MSRVAIDWSTAEVREGELRVAFEQPASGPQRKRMTALVERLQRLGEPWSEIAVKRGRLVVSDVGDGAEDDVRHFLESLVLEANATEDDGEPEHVDERDRRMTEAFQAFAPER